MHIFLKRGPFFWSEGESVSHSVMSDSSDPMACSPPGSSIHGIVQARVLEWGAIAFSDALQYIQTMNYLYDMDRLLGKS